MSAFVATTKLEDECALLRLTEDVARFPTGNGRRLLTEVIDHAQRHNHRGILLSQVSQYAAHFGLVDHATMAPGLDPDTVSAGRFIDIWCTAYPHQKVTKKVEVGWGRS